MNNDFGTVMRYLLKNRDSNLILDNYLELARNIAKDIEEKSKILAEGSEFSQKDISDVIRSTFYGELRTTLSELIDWIS